MSAILAVCGDTFCAMVSDGRYVEEPITGEKPHILKNDLPKVRKINRNVVVGFAGDTLAAVQIINAVDEYQTQYLTLEKVVKILREKGPVTVPREFVFLDRAAVGLGAVFLHLGAELNYHRMFEEALGDFSLEALTANQAGALEAAGLG